MLDRPGCDLSAPKLSLGGAKAVLVEFPRAYLPVGTPDELERISRSGVVRWLLTRAVLRVYARHGAQLAGRRRRHSDRRDDAAGAGPMTELAKSLLTAGLIDCLASDNHGDRRSLSAARVWLEEMGADEHAHLLTSSNAARVLADQVTIPVRLCRSDVGFSSSARIAVRTSMSEPQDT
jgi:hypothetical protein